MRPYYFKKDEEIIDKVRNKERYNVFIGDVHNCGEELEELLVKVANYLLKIGADVNEKVNVWFLGDLIHKGQSSGLRYILDRIDEGNVLWAICNRYHFTFECILGNHEDNHIAWKQGLRTEHTDGYQEVEDVLKSFDIDLQHEAFPITVDFVYPGKMITIGHAFATSSGEDKVLFYNQLAKRDLRHYLRLRYEDLKGDLVKLGKENPKQDIFWAQNYCNEGSHWPGLQEVVLFGHQCSYDSINGGPKYPLVYNSEDMSVLCIGLDTGCVHGGALSALVVNLKGDMHLVQVDNKQVYEAPKPIMKMVPNRHLGNYHLDSRVHDIVIGAN